MPAARLCPDCGKKIKSERHVCQPTSVDKMDEIKAWTAKQRSSDEDEDED